MKVTRAALLLLPLALPAPLPANPAPAAVGFCADPDAFPRLPDDALPPTDPALLVGRYLCEDQGTRFTLTIEANGRYALQIAQVPPSRASPAAGPRTETKEGRWVLDGGEILVAAPGASPEKEERDIFYPVDPGGKIIAIPVSRGVAVLRRLP